MSFLALIRLILRIDSNLIKNSSFLHDFRFRYSKFVCSLVSNSNVQRDRWTRIDSSRSFRSSFLREVSQWMVNIKFYLFWLEPTICLVVNFTIWSTVLWWNALFQILLIILVSIQNFPLHWIQYSKKAFAFNSNGMQLNYGPPSWSNLNWSAVARFLKSPVN